MNPRRRLARHPARSCLLVMLLSVMKPALALEPLTLQLKWKHAFQFAGYYAARELNFYREAGLDVTIREARPGMEDIAEEVASGRADFGIGSSSLILQRAAGKPVVVLAVIFQHSPYVLLCRKHAAISSLHDLVGKRIMMESGAEELLAYLKAEGVPEDRFQRLKHSFNIQDLIAGRTDAITAYSTREAYFLDQAKFPYQSFSPRAAGIDFYGDNLFTTEREIATHPGRVQAFLEASLRGWDHALKHPDEIITLIQSRYASELTTSLLRFEAAQLMPLIRQDLVALGYMNPGRWRYIADTYAEIGMLPGGASLEGFLHAGPTDTASPRWLDLYLVAALSGLLILGALTLYIIRTNRRLAESLHRAHTVETELRSLSTAVEQSPTSIVITGLDARIEYVNPRFTQVTGYTAGEAIGQNPRILNSGLTDRAVFSDMWLTLKQGRRWTGEFVNRRKNGELYWEEAHMSAVLDASNKPLRYVAVKLDVTARKRAENQERSRSQVLELLAKMAPLREILHAIIGDVETGNPEVRCGILLLDDERRHLATSVAPKLPDSFQAVFIGRDVGEELEFAGTTAFCRHRAIVDQIQTHPLWSPEYRKLAEQANVAACWSEPVQSSSGRVLGSFAVYLERPRSPGLNELYLMEQAARLAAIAIDRSRALEDLRRSEERHRLLADNASDVIWTMDLAGRYTYISPSCHRILGYAPDALLHTAMESILTPDSAKIAREVFQGLVDAVKSGRAVTGYRGELQAVRRDGSTVWTEVATSVLRNHEGVGMGILGVTRDISERKAADQTLQRLNAELESRVARRTRELAERGTQLELSEERFRLAMETSRDGLWDRDLVTGQSYYSPGFCLMLGYQPGELPDRIDSWIELMHPDDREQLKARQDEWYASGQFEMEFRMRHRDGQYRWILSRGRIVARDADGRPTRAIGTHVDITERKQSEQAIRELNANLEQKVAERTEQLAAASAAKSQFLAHMSHEIRTPMNAILGLTQILARDNLSSDQRELVQQISEAGSSLLHIINDILDFSKIEAGQMRVSNEPFLVGKVLDRVRSLTAVSATARGIGFRITKPPDLPDAVTGDALRLEQILINLCSNAIKFTDQGEVEVTVKPVVAEDTGLRLRFEVRDTGIGISPEGLAVLFQPFTQADASITRRFGGTGLGLAICRRLVELMGGTIGADSQPGAGSTFWFELPFVRAHEPPATTLTANLPSPPTAKGRLSGLRVLVVDDNAMNRKLAERALKLESAGVTLANDGQQALDILRSSPENFDAVLMDVQMPVLDGLSATRALRNETSFASLPVIALSAGVLPEEREAAFQAGMSGFLTKPLDLSQLVEALSGYRTRP